MFQQQKETNTLVFPVFFFKHNLWGGKQGWSHQHICFITWEKVFEIGLQTDRLSFVPPSGANLTKKWWRNSTEKTRGTEMEDPRDFLHFPFSERLLKCEWWKRSTAVNIQASGIMKKKSIISKQLHLQDDFSNLVNNGLS